MSVTTAIIKAGEKAISKNAEKAIAKTATKAITDTATKAITKTATDAATKAVSKALTNSIANTASKAVSKGTGSALKGLLGESTSSAIPRGSTSKATTGLAEKLADTTPTTSVAGSVLESEPIATTKIKIAEEPIRNVKPVSSALSEVKTPEVANVADGIVNYAGGDNYGGVLSNVAGKEEELAKLPAVSGMANSPVDKQAVAGMQALGGGEAVAPASSPNVATAPVADKVARPVSTAGVEETVAETPTTALANEISDLKAKVSSAGGGMSGGGTPTATASPDYGGLGDSGFKVKLKEGKTVDVPLGSSSAGSTGQQRAVRKLDDMTAKGMNATSKQYKGLVGKSGSIDGHYKTVAERIRAEKIDQANVAEKAQAALNLREDIKQQGLKYAEANGVTMDLSNIDNTIGLSATQKRKLGELGLGLDDMLGGNKVVTPTQAEEIYKVLRQYGYDWEDSKDALTSMAGKAMKKEADAVRDIIDNTMDNINVDYKTSLIEDAARNGEDPAYLRKLAGKPDFKFSDLRKDQSDWIAISDLAGNKMKEGSTINVLGVDTGVENPFTSAADKAKEKFYEWQAGKGSGAGAGAGGTIPPSGAENAINFVPAGGERVGTLGNLLRKAKGAGLVGAGVLGGLALGGGGSSSGDNTSWADMMPTSVGTAEENIDPYSTFTLGGYTYDELENGYMMALMDGNTTAAKTIASMMDMLDNKIERYNKAQESNKSGIASKQRAALNVLSSLMQSYESQGPIKGGFTQLMNSITGGGYNPSVAAYDSGAKGSLGTVIKALGDTGALSEGDQKRALELLPKTTDSEQAAKKKYQQLIQILQGAGAQ